MIKVNNLNFSYNKGSEFIKDLSINIESGKITTILGPNGSGKSTLLGLLCGQNKFKSGHIYIDGEDILSLKYKDLAKKVAVVHQQNSVPDDITVEELIAYGRIPYKGYFQSNDNDDDRIIDWAIEKTGLDKMRDKVVMSMSGGERQRVFIAMALAQKSKILFLDEPTTYLDIYHQIEILELVKELNREEGLTVVMVLHDINQAIKYSHNSIIMKNGSVIKSGESKSVINMQLLNDVYKIGGFIDDIKTERVFIPVKL